MEWTEGLLYSTRGSCAALCKTRGGYIQQAVNSSYQQALNWMLHMRLNFKEVADLAAGSFNYVFLPIYTWISKHLLNAEGAWKHYFSQRLIPILCGWKDSKHKNVFCLRKHKGKTVIKSSIYFNLNMPHHPYVMSSQKLMNYCTFLLRVTDMS